MNWLNIEIRLMRSPEYIGSEPIERATWLNLLAYCAEQENGGQIHGCASWKDRQWQQTCGVTAAEVRVDSALWHWEGDELIVWNYPIDKQAEVQAKREAGAKGGKSKASKHSGKLCLSTATSTATSTTKAGATISASTERKGKEIEGEEEGNDFVASAAPRFDEVMRFAKGQPMPISDDCVEAFFDEMEALEWTYKGQPCISKTAWHARFRKWATYWMQNTNKVNAR